MIDFLISYLTELKADSLPTQIANVLAILTVLIGIPVASYRLARRRYRFSLEEAEKLRSERDNAVEAIDDMRKERDKARREKADLEAAGPKGFTKAIDREARDGNTEHEAELAEAFIQGQRDALHRAFSAIAMGEIRQTDENIAADFENALLYARAAHACRPNHAETRYLIDELAQAAAMAKSGAKVKLKDERRRAKAHQARENLPNDIAALKDRYDAALDAGAYRVALIIAEYGEQFAERLAGKGSGAALDFKLNRAEGEWLCGRPAKGHALASEIQGPIEAVWGEDDNRAFGACYFAGVCLADLGRPDEALTLLETLLSDQKRVAGADALDTLTTRHAIASCLQDLGSAEDALARFEALLPDLERVNGAFHPYTLIARLVMAACVLDLGRSDEALIRLEALLPDMERVVGADHPDALTTRSRVSKALIALDRKEEAAKVHRGVTDRLLEKGLSETHRYVVRAREVDAALAERDARATSAEA